ncbi:cation:proton antiporter [Rickettsiales bacterium LUAb2]
MIIDVLSWIFMLLGLFFCSMGVLGLFRFPDLFAKQHAIGVIDTCGILFIIISLALKSGFTIISVKVLFLGILAIFLSAPTCNALIKAAIITKITPNIKKKE